MVLTRGDGPDIEIPCRCAWYARLWFLLTLR